MEFTVMTFNLRVNVASDGENAWPNRVESAVDVFRTHRPLVVGTQEGQDGMLSDLQTGLQDYAYVGTGREHDLTGEHCAIFYRTADLRIEESGQFWLSESPAVPSVSWDSACPRICTWAHFQLSSDPTVRFAVYNTHLDHVSQPARERGASLIWQMMRQQSLRHGVPAVLMGDFNAEPSNPVIRFLRGAEAFDGERAILADAWLCAEVRGAALEAAAVDNGSGAALIGPTYHGFSDNAEGGPIDYVFVAGDLRVQGVLVDKEKHLGKYPSDHYPVVVKVEM